MDIGISDLRDRLSEYVDRASKGETIRVIDGGRVKAVLGPVRADVDLDGGVASGWIRPGRGAPPTTWTRFRGARRVDEVLAEDRQK